MDYFANAWPYFILYGIFMVFLFIVVMIRRGEYYSNNVLPYASLSFLAASFVHTFLYQWWATLLLGALTVGLLVRLYYTRVATEASPAFAWIVVSGSFLLSSFVWTTTRWIEVTTVVVVFFLALSNKLSLEGSIRLSAR